MFNIVTRLPTSVSLFVIVKQYEKLIIHQYHYYIRKKFNICLYIMTIINNIIDKSVIAVTLWTSYPEADSLVFNKHSTFYSFFKSFFFCSFHPQKRNKTFQFSFLHLIKSHPLLHCDVLPYQSRYFVRLICLKSRDTLLH